MERMILTQLQGNITYLIFSLLIVIIIPLLIIIITLTINNIKIKPFLWKLKIYIIIFLSMSIGVVTIIPQAKFTINLASDYNQLVVLKEYGNIDNKLIKIKMLVIVIDNQQFYLSSQSDKADIGDYCEIKYLKNSKYIISLNKLDAHD